MFEGMMVITLALAYMTLTPNSQIGAQQILAILLMLIYQVLYQMVPPAVGEGSSNAGRLFGFLPLLALAMILFPVIGVQLSEAVTRFFGWLALATTTFLLLMFKFVMA